MPLPPGERVRKVYVDGVGARIIAERVEYLDENGKLVTESLCDFTKSALKKRFVSLDDFLTRWKSAERKQAIIEELEAEGLPLDPIAEELGKNLDPFDLICNIAFDRNPLTRRERAENVKKRDVFTKYGSQARAVLNALLDKYQDEGVLNLDDANVLKIAPFSAMGSVVQLINAFGGRGASRKPSTSCKTPSIRRPLEYVSPHPRQIHSGHYTTPPARFDRVVISWDTASTLSETSDWSVGTVWGAVGLDFYLFEVFRERLEAPNLRRAIIRLHQQHQASATLIEQTELGRALAQDLYQTRHLRAITLRPERDKLARLLAQAARFEAGQVHLPEHAPWLAAYLNELLGFPNAPHDDQIDSTSQALNWLTSRRPPNQPIVRRDVRRRDIIARKDTIDNRNERQE